jgi:hypothetical protein
MGGRPWEVAESCVGEGTMIVLHVVGVVSCVAAFRIWDVLVDQEYGRSLLTMVRDKIAHIVCLFEDRRRVRVLAVAESRQVTV